MEPTKTTGGNRLTTPTILEHFRSFPLYSQDGKGGGATVLARYFQPGTSWQWIILEADRAKDLQDKDTWLCFGATYSEDTPQGELGYFLLETLEEVPGVELDEEATGKALREVLPPSPLAGALRAAENMIKPKR